MKQNNINWTYTTGFDWEEKTVEIKSIDDLPKDIIGFVYKIIMEDGKFYIGRKELYTNRKRKFGKKEIAKIQDKRKKTYEYIKKESDWLTYNGSNKQLLEDLKHKKIIYKQILEFARTKKELTFLETKTLFVEGVLDVFTEKDCYNDNILGKFFRADCNIVK